MAQASLPALTAISEVVINDGQNPRHLAESQRGTPSDTSPPATVKGHQVLMSLDT